MTIHVGGRREVENDSPLALGHYLHPMHRFLWVKSAMPSIQGVCVM